jgi:ATP-dependent helicase HrpB
MNPPPTGLPVEGVVPAVLDALAGPGHAVLVAPPGSGKTTVVPLRLLEAPWRGEGKVVVLEPRRLATRAASRRMADLLGEEVGATVGYRTRDDRRVGPATRIEVVTEGILTRWLQHDPSLPGVAAVLFDELHERNLQTDLGLALALDVRRSLRPDLRLLAMSATLDAARVAGLLGGDGPGAPVVTSDSRSHPVDVRWAPRRPRERLEPAVADVVRRALTEEDGDVLVFLPGAGEITRVAELLVGEPVDVRPLYGMLPAAEQDAALLPGPFRKVVLATDIAETSLTVEGVRVVVDSGLARAPRFDARTGMTRLQVGPVSRASADQRAGRAGRTEPGVAYRMWSKLEHAARRAHIDPEITQVDLAGLALELAAWGVADPAALPFLDPPPDRTFVEGRRLLTALGALDSDGRLTAAGRRMSELPLHPRLGHMVVAAGSDAPLACMLAALLEERDVLRGHPDELPVDLGVRVDLLVDPARRHAAADSRALARVRARAGDLARRAGIHPAPVDTAAAGRVLALAYPDRLAVRRGTPGRFQLRTGGAAWVRATDSLAAEAFVVAADLDGNRRDARIRLAAAVTATEVMAAYADGVTEQRRLSWDRDRNDLVETVEQRLGGLVLAAATRRPAPGPATTAALLDRVRATRLAAMTWTDEATNLRARVAFLRAREESEWPDWSDRCLLSTLDTWLAPFLAEATGRDDLARVDVAGLLRATLSWDQGQRLDRLAPTHLEVPSGRRVPVQYGDSGPELHVRVQEMFGTDVTPTVCDGEVRVTLRLLTPADRPLQVTSDLAGFWAGSWQDARRELAGRYPKHAWPEDPAAAPPARRTPPRS